MDFIRPRNGNAALDKMIPFRDQPLDLTTGYRHLYPNATPDKPTVAAIENYLATRNPMGARKCKQKGLAGDNENMNTMKIWWLVADCCGTWHAYGMRLHRVAGSDGLTRNPIACMRGQSCLPFVQLILRVDPSPCVVC
ncbi:hypothetical protein ACLKA6_000703 [Drosophila palustris]